MWKSGTCHVLMARVAYVARPAATSRYGDAFTAKKSTLTTLNQISGPAMADKPAFERVKQSQPHPEERPKGASRRMATSLYRASILRDAVLRTAPHDELVAFFTRSTCRIDLVTSQSRDRASCYSDDRPRDDGVVAL